MSTSAKRVPWLRVFAEGAVIVASILLAFGIDAWWDGVQDGKDVRVGLEEILQNLAADSVELDVTLRSGGGQARSALWLLSRLGRPIAAPDSAALRFRGLYSRNPYQPTSSGYSGLRDAGRLGLVEPSSLRHALISYHETEQVQHVWRDQELEILQRAFWEAAELDVRLVTEDDFSGFRRREVELVRPWDSIPSDPRFEPRLRNLGSRAARVRDATLELMATNSALQQSIRNALRTR